jgi:hypothetical protein
MATSSFDEMMVIDTPEAVANLEAAFWEGEARRALNFKGDSILESIEKGVEFIRNNPDWLKEFIANAKEEMKKERLDPDEAYLHKMATRSFDEMMVIDTPDAAANLNAAYWEAERRGPLKFEGPGILEKLKESKEYIKNNPDWLKGFIAKAREEVEKEGSCRTEGDDLTE